MSNFSIKISSLVLRITFISLRLYLLRMNLGSWTHDGNMIDLKLFNNKENMDMTDFYNSTSAYVVTRHMEGTKVVKKYDCCPEPYPSLNFR